MKCGDVCCAWGLLCLRSYPTMPIFLFTVSRINVLLLSRSGYDTSRYKFRYGYPFVCRTEVRRRLLRVGAVVPTLISDNANLFYLTGRVFSGYACLSANGTSRYKFRYGYPFVCRTARLNVPSATESSIAGLNTKVRAYSHPLEGMSTNGSGQYQSV